MSENKSHFQDRGLNRVITEGDKMRYAKGGLASTLAFVLVYLAIGCDKTEPLEPPYSAIFPTCETILPEFEDWNESSSSEGAYYLDGDVLRHHHRSCRSEDVKLFMAIMVLDNPVSAELFAQRNFDSGPYDGFTKELPRFVRWRNVSQLEYFLHFYFYDTESFFYEGIEKDVGHKGEVSQGIVISVGRYVGRFEIDQVNPSINPGFSLGYGPLFFLDTTYEDALYEVVDQAIVELGKLDHP